MGHAILRHNKGENDKLRMEHENYFLLMRNQTNFLTYIPMVNFVNILTIKIGM